MAADWYRRVTWTPDDQADFESRLARARAYNRPQYLRIQGVHLQRAGNIVAARELWLRVVNLVPVAELQGSMDRASALELLADSYAESDPSKAEGWYRQLLAEHPSLQGSSDRAELSLAEVLIGQGNPAAAREVLTAWTERRRSHTPDDLLRASVVLAEVAEAEGDRRTARQAARQALEAVDLPAPYANHPQVGVARLDPAIHQRLARLARRRWFQR